MTGSISTNVKSSDKVTESSSANTKSSDKVTGSTYVNAILMGRGSVFRLRIEQGNKLPFDDINPEDWRRGRIPLGLNKASAF